jgi:hypothetical protein
LKRIVALSGQASGFWFPGRESMSSSGRLLSAGFTKMSSPASAVDLVKAISLPSGDQTGSSLSPSKVIWVLVPLTRSKV